jgi:hypothetical protein
MDTSAGPTFAAPNILVPRKRPSARGDLKVQAALDPTFATPRKSRKKARCSTPINLDLTEDSSHSKFQDRLFEEGCGSQVTPSRHRYIFPFYSSNHSYNPHLFCKYVGPSGSLIFSTAQTFFILYTGLLQGRTQVHCFIFHSPPGSNFHPLRASLLLVPTMHGGPTRHPLSRLVDFFFMEDLRRVVRSH